jgi:hypothetical protein
MGSVRFLSLGCVVLLLAACGGGGGGGGSRTVGNFTISTNAVTFDAEVGGPSPATATVTGSITGVDETVFLTVVLTSNGIANASVAVTGETTGALTIFPKHPAQLGAGTFNDTVTVSACLDAGCARPVGGSPKTISVTYNVRGLSVSPSGAVFSAFEGTTPAPQQIALSNHTGANWTSSVTYQGAASGWLTLTPTTGATQGAQQVTLNASSLDAPAIYTATVQITAGSRTQSIPVTYTVSPNLTLSQTTATLTAVSGQTAPPVGASINVTAAVGPPSFTTFVAYGPTASNWLTATAAPGTLTLVPQSVGLAPGSYQATVVLTPTTGTPVSVAVTYTLAPSVLTFSPDNPLFTISGASTATPQVLQRTITTADTGAPLNWTASSSVPWLTVTSSGASGQNAVVTLVPSALAPVRNGSHQVGLTFTYNGPFVVNQTRELTVDLSLRLPSIEYVMPHVAYLNEEKELVLRGSGFDQPGGAAVTFDGTAAATVEAVSDTELRVTPPSSAVAGASRPLLGIVNALGIDRTAEIVVRAKPAYGNQQLDDGGITLPTGWRVVYDAERDFVFGPVVGSASLPVIGDSVLKFALDPTGVAAPTFSSREYPGLNDVELSADGRTLYVVTTTELHFVDPVSMNDIKAPAPLPFVGPPGRLAVINDGRILMPQLHRFYVPSTNQFELVDEQISDGLMEVSADGSRVALQAVGNSGSARLCTFDASTNEFRCMTEDLGSQVVSLDRAGTRIAGGSQVFNADLTSYGAAPEASFSRLSPAGDRLYSLSFSPTTQVRVFDTSAPGNPFPELPPIDVPFGASAMGISLNGEHVFIMSTGAFFVVEP